METHSPFAIRSKKTVKMYSRTVSAGAYRAVEKQMSISNSYVPSQTLKTPTHSLTKQVHYFTFVTKDVCSSRSRCSVCVVENSCMQELTKNFPQFKIHIAL